MPWPRTSVTAYGEKSAEALEAAAVRVSVAGRMRAKRVMGKASFAKLEDSSGAIQVFLQQQALGEVYDEFKSWDVGDVIGAEGILFRTKTGELSVRAERVVLLTKSLRPLPDKWHGIADTETALPAPLCRSDHERGEPARVRNALANRALPARLPRCARLPRGRDADAASDSRRRRGAAVQDASQRARRRTCTCASRPSSI